MRYCSRYTKVTVALALLTLAFIVLGLVVATDDLRVGLIGVGFFGVMFLASFYYVRESYMRTVTLDVDGLTIHRSFRGPLRIAWEDIQSVSYAHASWKRKSSASPAVLRVDVAMNGMGTLTWHLDRYAAGTITTEARQYLSCSDGFLLQGLEAATK